MHFAGTTAPCSVRLASHQCPGLRPCLCPICAASTPPRPARNACRAATLALLPSRPSDFPKPASLASACARANLASDCAKPLSQAIIEAGRHEECLAAAAVHEPRPSPRPVRLRNALHPNRLLRVVLRRRGRPCCCGRLVLVLGLCRLRLGCSLLVAAGRIRVGWLVRMWLSALGLDVARCAACCAERLHLRLHPFVGLVGRIGRGGGAGMTFQPLGKAAFCSSFMAPPSWPFIRDTRSLMMLALALEPVVRAFIAVGLSCAFMATPYQIELGEAGCPPADSRGHCPGRRVKPSHRWLFCS